jgi:heptosyltransferase I
MSPAPASLCLFRLSALGDVTHMLPVVRTLQTHWPQTQLTWVIGKLEHQLVRELAGVEFITFDKSAGRAAYRDLWRQLRGRRFDQLWHMQAALRASVATLGIRAKVKIGFDKARARDAQWLFTNRKIAANPRAHVLDGFFDFCTAAGLNQRELRWDLPVEPAAAMFAAEKLGDQPTLVINPCSSARANNYRNWRAERYASVAEHAVEQHGLQVVLTGGPAPAERAMAEEIQSHSNVPLLNLAGQTSIPQMLAVLARARAIIAPDTGPAHMGTAVGTPVIGLYATSNPARTGPYLSQEWTVNRYPQAVQQFLGKSVDEVRWGQRVRDPAALDLIEVADVCGRLDACLAAQASTGVSG